MNHSLIRVHQRYPLLEKVTFIVRIVSRKLRHYFGAHEMIVLIPHPLKNVLDKSESN